MSRRDAREIAFKLVFAYTFDKNVNNDALEEYLAGADEDDSAYVREVYAGVTNKFNELENDISLHIEKFELNRIFKVDFAILLLAIYEIKYMNSIPYKVSVDEAVNLAQQYSTQKSGKYINGVLAKFAR